MTQEQARSAIIMKITVEIDCTPAEARQFFGLPNVEPMQAAMMTKLEKRMSEEMDRFSPEALMKTWFSLFPQNTEWAQKMFENLAWTGKDAATIVDYLARTKAHDVGVVAASRACR